MFRFSLHSGTSVTGTTDTWGFLNTIKMRSKEFDQKNLTLVVEITSGGSLAIAPSARFTESGSTFLLKCAGGTSTVLSGTSILFAGTSVGGPNGNGRYWIPLYFTLEGSGSTEHLFPLRGVPYLTFEYLAKTNNVSFSANLVAG